jgi:general secretion pathway protein C
VNRFIVQSSILLRNHFGWVVATLLLPSAYFQARGISYLLATRLVAEAHETGAGRPSNERNLATSERAISAEPILARNPFDSVTGPLGAAADGGQEPQSLDLSDPLTVPDCEGFRAASVAESSDPFWSSAVVRAPGDRTGTLVRVGQQIGGKEVAFIGYDAYKHSPAVWLVSDSTLCEAVVFQDHDSEPAISGQASSEDAARDRKADEAPAPRTSETLKKSIKRVSATEFTVDRAQAEALFGNDALLLRALLAKPLTSSADTGLVLSQAKNGGMLNRIGLRAGDELKSINGYPIATPEQALQAYARVRTAGTLRLELERRGKPMTLEYRLQ